MTTTTKRTRRLTLAVGTLGLAAATALLGGCGPDQHVEHAQSNAPASTSAPQVTTPTAPAPAPSDDTAAFGDTVQYDNGIAVTVTAPQMFSPSATAFGADKPLNYVFTVTIVNGAQTRLDPSMIYVSAASDGVEADPVFDSEQDINGPGQTSVAAGGTTTFKVAFSFLSDAGITVEVHPNVSLDPAIFEAS